MKSIERERKGREKLQAIFDKKMAAARKVEARKAEARAAEARAAHAANADMAAAAAAAAAAQAAAAAVVEAEEEEEELDAEMADLITMFGTKAEVSSHTPTYGGRRTRRSQRRNTRS
jgi:hypothetical protein